ncbi:MAG: glycosyltransferase N-terminal domain-containing protein, partial [Spirochaetota bacterium]
MFQKRIDNISTCFSLSPDMLFLYQILGFCLFPILRILAFFHPHPQGRKFLAVRKESKQKLQSIPTPQSDTQVFWLHGASVGELDQCNALVKVLREKYPKVFILQSVFSLSVSEKQLEKTGADATFFLPIDLPFTYNFIFHKFQPSHLFLAAWDTWPNLLLSAKKYSCESFLFCATLNDNSGRKKGLAKKLTKQTLQLLSGISPTHEMYLQTFQELTDNKVPTKVCGDSRFDSVAARIESQQAHQHV